MKSYIQDKGRQIGYLNVGNTVFLDFLKSLFGMDILHKNKIKIYLENRHIYIGNIDTGGSVYNFLISQQGDTKKLMISNLWW